MPVLNSTITLSPISSKAKSIIQQHGDQWVVVEKAPNIPTFRPPENWMLVKPINSDNRHDMLWINETEDEHYQFNG